MMNQLILMVNYFCGQFMDSLNDENVFYNWEKTLLYNLYHFQRFPSSQAFITLLLRFENQYNMSLFSVKDAHRKKVQKVQIWAFESLVHQINSL